MFNILVVVERDIGKKIDTNKLDIGNHFDVFDYTNHVDNFKDLMNIMCLKVKLRNKIEKITKTSTIEDNILFTKFLFNFKKFHKNDLDFITKFSEHFSVVTDSLLFGVYKTSLKSITVKDNFRKIKINKIMR